MGAPGWVPNLGDAVTYQPHDGADQEEGVVTEVVTTGDVRVQFAGSTGPAKLCRVRDLNPQRPSQAWG